ncbi:MAG: hypothetical protein P4L48_14755 [Mycobacterium sp.]|nr:hypothetical protein [Mycobacterium sp.]
MAQQALNAAASLVGSLYVPTTTSGNATVPVGTQGIMVTTPGVTSYSQLPNTTTLLLVTGSGDTVSAIGGDNPTTVEAGSGSSVIFVNNDTSSVPSSIFLGGGNNYIGEGSSVASAVINVDGSSVSALGSATTGLGGAYIDGSQGYTTVNLYNNAFVYLNTGSVAAGIGHDVVVAQSGSAEILGIGGSSTVPVTVTANAGSTLFVNNDATAFIAPGAGNVVLSAGTTNLGQATLFGGTGSDTVFGGGNGGNQESGYFQGGTAGNNIMVSSTVSGATTIVGAGNNNLLGTFANNDSVIAGSGNNDTLAAWANGTGDTLIGGAGTDTIFGSSAGDTYIGFGSGSAVASGFHGSNTYFQAAAGGVDSITDFLPGSDVFSLTLSAHYENVASITVTNITTLGASGSQVTLSDHSTIDFLNVKVTNSNFT